MAQTIQLKRGTDANFGDVTLAAGEPAFVTDEGKFYIGNGASKVLINPDLGTAALLDTGTASGNVPVLNSDGKLDESVIPAIAISDTFVAASEVAMLALSNAQIGDVAVRTDLGYSYILATEPASTLTNWVQLSTPSDAPVVSVNGKTGAVVLVPADIGAEPAITTKKTAFNVDFETSAANIQMNGTASAGTANTVARADHIHATDTSRAPLASPVFTGSPEAPTVAVADNSTALATTAFVKSQNYLTNTDIIDGGTF